MPFNERDGCASPGKIGRARHVGAPLSVAEILNLPDNAEVVITWSGGNGPWPCRILVDQYGTRRVESAYAPPLLTFGRSQRIPLHRITLGWDDYARAWHDSTHNEPAHVKAKWARLRGHPRLAGCVITDLADRVLLLHRYTDEPQWELPGGKVNPGEEPDTAARRETLEETGLTVQRTRPLGVTQFEQGGVWWDYSWFAADEVTGTARICEPQTFDALRAWPLDDLRRIQRDLSPNLRARFIEGAPW